MTTLRRAGVPVEATAKLPHDCPAGLGDVLLKCLSPDAADRYPSAAVAAQEIELCLQPRARQLLHGAKGWQAIARQHPVLSTITCGLLPNMVMCVLNIAYNHEQLIKKLVESNPAVEPVFHLAVAVINAVGYAIGLTTTLWAGGPAFRAVGQLVRGRTPDPPVDHRTIGRCLWIGDTAAIVAAMLWIVSGPIFPTWIELAVGPSSGVSLETYVQFIVSDALSGLIAATQSFYVMTFLVMRFCYPPLLKTQPMDATQMRGLLSLAWRSRIYFGLAVAVPFIAVTAAAFIEGSGRWPIVVLGGIGLIGFALAYFFDVTLRGDLAALAGVINPSGDKLANSDSLDSFLTGSRR
jgi:hypothetical protein